MNNLTFGTEAEFLLLNSNGQILRLVPHILQGSDLIGADGHQDTIEIRTTPTESARTQFNKLRSAISKYITLVSGYKSDDTTLMRGGAYCNTPLSVHIHFGNFTFMERVPLMLNLLHEVLVERFLELVGSASASKMRRSAGYGSPGLPAFRNKGPGWWEWREPFSCLTPPHMAVLLGVAELVARAVTSTANVADLETLQHTKLKTLQESILFLGNLAPNVDWDIGELSGVAEALLRLGEIDWTRDLAPLWIGM